jgi:PAS domain-containing protein
METLSQRKHDFSRVIDKASEFSYRLRFEGDTPMLEMISEEFPEICGLSVEAVVGKNGFDRFVHEDDLKKLQENFRTVKKGKSSTCQYRLKIRDGSYAEVIDFCKPGRDKKDEQLKTAHGAVSVDTVYRKVEKL